jgi:hypothetical protein
MFLFCERAYKIFHPFVASYLAYSVYFIISFLNTLSTYLLRTEHGQDNHLNDTQTERIVTDKKIKENK